MRIQTAHSRSEECRHFHMPCGTTPLTSFRPFLHSRPADTRANRARALTGEVWKPGRQRGRKEWTALQRKLPDCGYDSLWQSPWVQSTAAWSSRQAIFASTNRLSHAIGVPFGTGLFPHPACIVFRVSIHCRRCRRRSIVCGPTAGVDAKNSKIDEADEPPSTAHVIG